MNGLEALNHYLCPPGEGVYTVHTGRNNKEALQTLLYSELSQVDHAWRESLKKIEHHHGVVMLGVCADTGGGILRGANWGPLFVREALYADGLIDSVLELGDVRIIPHLLHDKYLNAATIQHCRKALYHDQNLDLAVSPLSITQEVAAIIHRDYPQLALFSIGGDHSISYPLITEFLNAKHTQQKKVAVLHFDAHTDLLVERLGIDICFST